MHRSLRSFSSPTVVAAAFATLLLATACGGGGQGDYSSASLVTLTTASLPAGSTGQPYAAQLTAHFPHPPGQFVVSTGSLPPGLVLDPLTGAMTGFPRQVGRFKFDISARDGTDLTLPPNRDSTFSEAVKSLTVDVARGAPNILPQALPAAQYRHSYLRQIDVAGGSPPYTFTLAGGALPAGISLAQDGKLGNFPTEANVAQGVPFEFDAKVTDGDGLTDTAHFELTVVVLPLIILTSHLDPVAQHFPCNVRLELASTGGGQPIIWSQVPPTETEVLLADIGMEITPGGILCNQSSVPGPTAPGTYRFTIQVTDEASQGMTRQYALTVNPGPVLTAITPNRASQPGPYVVTGYDFQPGAVLVFKPGPTEVTLTPTYVSATELRFNTAPSAPGGTGGATAVRVRNPDTGAFTQPGAFVFPATTVSFGAKGFLSSGVSSTGLACRDVDGDGFADVLHSGAAGIQTYSGSVVSTAAGLVYHHNLGTVPPTFDTLVLDAGNFYDCAFADVNTDGRMDVVGLGQTEIRVFLNGVAGDPLGTFSAGPTSTHATGFSFPSAMTMGRFDTDAIPDLAFGVGYYPNGGASGRVYTMIGDGSGGFTLVGSATTTINNSYGVVALVAADSDGDGRDEICAGVGMGYTYQGPLFNYNELKPDGSFAAWVARGSITTPYYYGTTTGMVAGDFQGNGTASVLGVMSGAPNYSGGIAMRLCTGSGFNSFLTVNGPSAVTKSMGTIDADFDSKLDWAVSTNRSSIEVYVGSSQSSVVTLDVSAGSPGVATPNTGRIASGDLNGDGRPDLLVTTSSWICEGMAAWQNYYYYELGIAGDGGSQGVVFYLNTSD